MLTEDERVGRFMSWEEKAGVLARNAIRFLKLGKEFEDKVDKQFRQFKEHMKDERWAGWRHRDSAVELDEGDELGSFDTSKVKPVVQAVKMSPTGGSSP
jgi:aminocarboxymuconate-semialdehyde decarboxylase